MSSRNSQESASHRIVSPALEAKREAQRMTDWFARPVLHISDVDASLRFYVDHLGFTIPWCFKNDDGKASVAQVDRQGCALILCNHWPEKVGKGLMFISLNV